MRLSALVVDDDLAKAKLLTAFLFERGFAEEDISVANDAAQARQRLQSRTFDLMLIDVLLPSWAGAEPSGSTSVELLRQLLDAQQYQVPACIVAITASIEAQQEFEEEFRRLTTLIVEVTASNQDWRASLESAVSHVKASKNRKDAFDVDVCIMTALRNPELRAAQEALPITWGPEELFVRGSTCRRGEYADSQRKLRVVCAHSNLMGMVPTGHLASQLISTFRPRILAMTGICAGMASDIQLGDVVIATKSWDWQSGKWDGKGKFHMAPEQVSGSSQLISLALGAEHALASAHSMYVGRKPASSPRLRAGPMMSGSAVVAYDGLKRRLLIQHRKAEGLDMECYGLYFSASHATDPVPEVICIKSVCDLATASKNSKYQPFCSFVSASVLWDTLLRAPIGKLHH